MNPLRPELQLVLMGKSIEKVLALAAYGVAGEESSRFFNTNSPQVYHNCGLRERPLWFPE